MYRGERLDEGVREEAPKGRPGGWGVRKSGGWENSITSSCFCPKPAVYARQKGTVIRESDRFWKGIYRGVGEHL